MTSLCYGAVLVLLVLSVAAAPADREESQDEHTKTGLALEDRMSSKSQEGVPNDTHLDSPEIVFSGGPAPSGTSTNQEDEEDSEGESSESSGSESSSAGSEDEERKEESEQVDYDDYGSLPSWYVQELLGNDNSSQPDSDTYQKYKSELDELILDVKLYQVYHSIKTLKRVLDDLLAEERREEEGLIKEGAGSEEMTGVEMGGVDTSPVEDPVESPVSLFSKQLGALKDKGLKSSWGKGLKSRRTKRDLSWDQGRGLSWNSGELDPNWWRKADDDELPYDVTQKQVGLNGDFDLTKEQIQELISTFLDDDEGGYSPRYKNDVNINLGNQRMTQEILNPSKRALNRNDDYRRDFLARLPTLEGLRKRGYHAPSGRSAYKRGYPSTYREALPDDKARLRYQVEKLARKLATNNRRQRGRSVGPSIQDFTNGPAGDINMWFENNPRYTIGIDDNIGDTVGITEMSELPRISPDRIGALYDERARYGPSRLGKRGRIVEEPSLPGPYQGYFMEGQLWHELFNKRSPPERVSERASDPLEFKPKTLKIGGPNAWGNFIFIGDEGAGGISPETAGKYFSQSFGDEIGDEIEETAPPTEIEMEGLWVDGDDEGDAELESELTKKEKEWLRRILGLDD